MAFFDIYNIENWTAGEPSPWYVKLMPVWTTLLGFSLGLVPGLISRLRDKWRTGELFNTELATLKIGLEEQVIEIRRYKNEFLNPPMQTTKLLGLSLVLLHKFEIIKTFNKITLIKYFEK